MHFLKDCSQRAPTAPKKMRLGVSADSTKIIMRDQPLRGKELCDVLHGSRFGGRTVDDAVVA
jgi:hypothetical protein